MRSVTAFTLMPLREASPGFVQGTVTHGGPQNMSPFLTLTDFRMSEPTFPPHPHAGFSAVTYLFLDSDGALINRDSLGGKQLIEPGSLHWTQAAAGMMHEEVPAERGIECHGLQLFVNLRGSDKAAEPKAFHVATEAIPEIEPDGSVLVRVVAGSYQNETSPLCSALLTPVTFLDIHLGPHATYVADVQSDQRAVMLVVFGSVTINDAVFRLNIAATLDGPDPNIEFVAGPKGANIVLLLGEPIREPVVMAGPFVMTNESDIVDAQTRFKAGAMGHLNTSF